MAELIRMRHKDPNIRSSFVESYDDTGAALVDGKNLRAARDHGYYVQHRHEDPTLQPAAEVVPAQHADETASDDPNAPQPGEEAAPKPRPRRPRVST